jgi:polysaccharide biosynthesis protein PslG
VTIPASPGRFSVTSYTGQSLPPVAADGSGLTITLTDAPQYLSPEQPDRLLRVAAALQRAPLDALVTAPQPSVVSLAFRNPLAEPLHVGVSRDRLAAVAPGQTVTLEYRHPVLRDADPRTVQLPCVIDGMGELTQATRVTVSNPLSVEVLPATRDTLPLHIASPSGEAFRGVLRVTESAGLSPARTEIPLSWEAGRRASDVSLPLSAAPEKSWRVGLRIEGPDGSIQLDRPTTAYRAVDEFARLTAESLPKAYHLVPDGDAKVASMQTMTLAAPPAGPPQPGVAPVRITYRFEKGWKFARLAPQESALQAIEGQPLAFGLWVYGDGSGNHLRCRLADATGQTFQPDGGQLDWRGWRYVRFPLNASLSGHWGGENDGVIHYPLRWDTLLLIDSAHREQTSGEVYIASPTLILAAPGQ